MLVLLSRSYFQMDTRSASGRAHFLRRGRKNLRGGEVDEDVSTLLVQMRPESTISLSQELDAESRSWVDGLSAPGPERARALERLHDLLLRAAHAEAHRRSHLYPQIGGTELDDLCHQAANDAVIAVT